MNDDPSRYLPPTDDSTYIRDHHGTWFVFEDNMDRVQPLARVVENKLAVRELERAWRP
jgi:hypothetical protein